MKRQLSIFLIIIIISLATVKCQLDLVNPIPIFENETSAELLLHQKRANIKRILEESIKFIGKPSTEEVDSKFIGTKLPFPVGLSGNSMNQKILQELKQEENTEDKNLDIVSLIRKYGFRVEQHEIQTSDGYLLTMFRIPGNGSITFLMHGLLMSADDWITAGPESALAYLLAREGYDVWLGNARGNKHSRKHLILSPKEAEFWDFSWDEIGRYDLPAMIDYTLHHTKQTKIKYVGHSQGTTSFFVMCSEKPEYNSKISIMIALSAVAWMSHVKSPIIRLVSPFNPLLHSVAMLFGLNEFLPDNEVLNMLKFILCEDTALAQFFCTTILFLLSGFDYQQLNVTNLPVIYSHTPSSAATKQLIHYGQEVESAKFRQFNYGLIKNLMVYHSISPPEYPVHRITAPVAIFYSDGDWLAHVDDVRILINSLKKNITQAYKVKPKNFNHVDFLWARNVKEILYDKVINILHKY